MIYGIISRLGMRTRSFYWVCSTLWPCGTSSMVTVIDEEGGRNRNDSCGDSETQWCTLRKRPAKSQKAGRHTLIGRARKGDRRTDIFMEWYPCNMIFMVSLIRLLKSSEHWKLQMDSKSWMCALETYILTQPLMSSVTSDKSTDISLSGISH